MIDLQPGTYEYARKEMEKEFNIERDILAIKEDWKMKFSHEGPFYCVLTYTSKYLNDNIEVIKHIGLPFITHGNKLYLGNTWKDVVTGFSIAV